MVGPDDSLSSVSGDATNPTYVNTTTSFYHAALGAGVPNGINSLLFPVYPDLAYDSWVTIGLQGTPNALAGEANVSTVQSNDNPWFTNFDPGGGLPGGNISIDDGIGGAWYALNGDANGVAGADEKVLAGQFTTTGELDGQLYVQVFIGGDGSNEFRDTFYFGSSAPSPGCTDAAACNYDGEADLDDGSCTYPEATNLDCDGNCLNDADGDGICSEDDLCEDLDACNYDDAANEACAYVDECGVCGGDGIADGACDCDGNVLDECGVCGGDGIPAGDCDCDGNQLDALGVCGGSCTADTDADGLCDDADNCIDLSACNYADAANEACAYLDECGICGGDGIPAGDCDCDGNVLDECGICGGDGIPAGDCDCNGNQLDAPGE